MHRVIPERVHGSFLRSSWVVRLAMRAADVVIVVRFGWRGGGQDGRKMLSVWKHEP